MSAINVAVAATASSSPLSLPIDLQSSTAIGGRHHHHQNHHTSHHQHPSSTLHSAAGLHSSHHAASNSSSNGVISTSLSSASLGRSTPRSPSSAMATSSSSFGGSIVIPPPPPLAQPLMPGLRQGAFSMSGSALSGITTPPLSMRSSGHQTVHSLSLHCRTTLPPLGSLHHHHHHHFAEKQLQHQSSSSSSVTPFCFHQSSGSSSGGGLGGSTAGPIGGGGPGATASSTVDNNACRLIEYRGAQVAAFQVDGRELICLPQAFDLFLKHLVGGLHTVYTKLKRLDITPVVCNVEQVRVLRGLGAIQPGVNRCKLISPREFDVLYDDCTNSSARPGRPPKRTSSMSTAEVALEHLKQSKLSGFSDFYSQSRLLADAKKALTGFATSPTAAAVSGFLPYLDFKKSPLFAAAAAAAAAAGCYGYSATTHQQGHHHSQHLGGIAGTPSLPPPPIPPPHPPAPQTMPPTSLTSHLPSALHSGAAAAAFVPFGTAAYHASMMSLAASMHAAHQLQRHQQASSRRDGSSNDDAMPPLSQRHQTVHARNVMTLSRDAKLELDEVNVDVEDEDEDEMDNGHRATVLRGKSPLQRARSNDGVNRLRRSTDDIYNNNNNDNNENNCNVNIRRGPSTTGNQLPRSHFLSAVPYHIMHGCAHDDTIDKPLNLETTFRRRASSGDSKRSDSSSSVDGRPRRAKDIDVDNNRMPTNRGLSEGEEQQSDRYALLKQSPAQSVQSACDSYAATSSSEDGKQSRSTSVSRSVDGEDGDRHQTRLDDDEDQVISRQLAPIDGGTAQLNVSRWPLFGADILRDNRLVLPLSTPVPTSTHVGVVQTPALEGTLAAAAVRAGTVDTGSFSIESLLSNVQGLLKAVVDGARHREHQSEVERALLRKQLKREKENRRQLERRLTSTIDRFADVTDTATTRSGESCVSGDRLRRASDEPRQRSDIDGYESDLDGDDDDVEDRLLRMEDINRRGTPKQRVNGGSLIIDCPLEGTGNSNCHRREESAIHHSSKICNNFIPEDDI